MLVSHLIAQKIIVLAEAPRSRDELQVVDTRLDQPRASQHPRGDAHNLHVSSLLAVVAVRIRAVIRSHGGQWGALGLRRRALDMIWGATCRHRLAGIADEFVGESENEKIM
jgi:hypothetical protein